MGQQNPTTGKKIAVAIRKSFISTQKEITDEAVYTIVDEVEQISASKRSKS